MKPLFFILAASVSLGSFSNAQPSIDPRAGGYEFCKQFTFDSDKAKCLNTVQAANFIDPVGMDLCNTYSFDSKKIDCLAKVVNQAFDPATTAFCKTFTFDSDKATCTSLVASKYASADALSICSTYSFDSKKLECLRSTLVAMSAPQPAPPVANCKRAEFVDLLTNIERGITTGAFGQALRAISRLTALVDVCFVR